MRIHGQYLSYKQAICTNVYNGKQSGFGSYTCLTLALQRYRRKLYININSVC